MHGAHGLSVVHFTNNPEACLLRTKCVNVTAGLRTMGPPGQWKRADKTQVEM